MQNHFQEQIDEGMKTAGFKQGTGGLPKAPDTSTLPPMFRLHPRIRLPARLLRIKTRKLTRPSRKSNRKLAHRAAAARSKSAGWFAQSGF